MPDLTSFKPQGMLHEGWSAQVNDYALACGWTEDCQILITGDVAGGLYAFEGSSGSLIWQHQEVHQGGLLALAVHPLRSLLATAGQDGVVHIWDCLQGKIVKSLSPGKGWAEHLCWSNDGSLLAIAISRRVYVFTIEGKEEWRSTEQPSTVSSIRWSSTNELALSCYGRVLFVEPINNKITQQLEWPGSLVSMVLSPNGDIVACGSQDNSVHFWRRSTGKDAEMTGYPGKPSQLAFDQTGRFLATGGSETITVWNFQGDGPEGSLPGRLSIHPEPISSLSFANSGPLLASGARDGSIFVWYVDNNGDGDLVGGAFVGDLVSTVSWRPDDAALAVVNSNGGVEVFNFKTRN